VEEKICGAMAAALTKLLQRYGAAELQAAIAEALERDVPHPNAVRFALERRRQERQQPPRRREKRGRHS